MPIVECGAKTRAGGRCKAPAMKNGRCRVHGGQSTGAPKGNANAVKHGFYSDALRDDEERELYGRAAPGSVDDEIRLAKVKLFRYVKASGSVELQDMVDGALEVIRKQGEDMRGVDYDRRELKVAAPDYADLIIRTLDLIRKLELARVQLLAAKGEEPVEAITINITRAKKTNGAA
jgi:hypothetical protein